MSQILQEIGEKQAINIFYAHILEFMFSFSYKNKYLIYKIISIITILQSANFTRQINNKKKQYGFTGREIVLLCRDIYLYWITIKKCDTIQIK